VGFRGIVRPEQTHRILCYCYVKAVYVLAWTEVIEVPAITKLVSVVFVGSNLYFQHMAVVGLVFDLEQFDEVTFHHHVFGELALREVVARQRNPIVLVGFQIIVDCSKSHEVVPAGCVMLYFVDHKTDHFAPFVML